MINKKKFTAEFGGKERTFWLGLGFLAMFVKNSKIDIDELTDAMTKNPFKVMPELLFYSLKYGYDRVGADLDFNIYDVTEWIDEDGGVSSPFTLNFMQKLGAAIGGADTNEETKIVEKKGVKKKENPLK